jgi:hypothetical protein
MKSLSIGDSLAEPSDGENRKSPARTRNPDGAVFDYCAAVSGSGNARGLRALGAIFHVKRNRLPFGENLEAFGLDLGEVHEYVFAAIGGSDEAKAFGFVEPFDSTCRHFDLPLKLD